jgi:hypothetical protein
MASAIRDADARAAATPRLAVFGDGRTLRASGARPSRKRGQEARFAARWLRFGYARKDKGLAAKLTLCFVGRPCRDRTCDQRIKSLTYRNGHGEQVEEAQEIPSWRRRRAGATEPIPNRNLHDRRYAPRFSTRINWLQKSPPTDLRTRAGCTHLGPLTTQLGRSILSGAAVQRSA